MANRLQVRISVAKLIELAYSEDKGLTTNIVLSKRKFKLRVSSNGNATLSGELGSVIFKGDPALTNLGAKIKVISISFSPGEDKNVNYTAMFSFSAASNISLSGTFNIEELIISCSGLLCRAARLLKNRNKKNQEYELKLKQIMGY